MKQSLLRWQQECLQQWAANHYRGIVNAVTGAGKTTLAMGAIETLIRMHGRAGCEASDQPRMHGRAGCEASDQPRITDRQSLKIKIIVPKTFLMYQWQNALKDELDIPPEEIGFFSGAYKTPVSRQFIIYVINSARYSLTKHIIDDIGNTSGVLLIADECHHYGTEENSNIFNFLSLVPKDFPVYTLGLSATPFGKNYGTVLTPSLGDEIYRFTFYHALREKILPSFAIFNICVNFEPWEEIEYDDFSEKLGIALFQLRKKYGKLHMQNSSDFFTVVQRIAQTSPDREVRDLAQAVLFLSIRRKEVVYLAESRIACVIDLVKRISKSSKIIIFGERIKTAVEIYDNLRLMWPNQVGIYHSKLPALIRKQTLRQFENMEIRILISCKTLDEGLNISETDVGIVVSSTSSKRQRIQRLGRILRKKQRDCIARFYYIFVGDTTEEEAMLSEMSDSRMNGLVQVIDILYDKQLGSFHNHYYENITEKVFYDLSLKYNNVIMDEFRKNACNGILSSDWLLTEKDCLEKIKTADSKGLRNYYVTMLLLVRAREHDSTSTEINRFNLFSCSDGDENP
jgi:superfamily II DNA or RNA helicase